MKKVAHVSNTFQSFCQTLDMDKWDKAQEEYDQLSEESQEPLPVLRANTKELFQKGFTFDSIAQNDDVVAILESVDTAQSNLNANPKNEVLLNTFVKTANNAAEKLETRYSEFWRNPLK